MDYLKIIQVRGIYNFLIKITVTFMYMQNQINLSDSSTTAQRLVPYNIKTINTFHFR